MYGFTRLPALGLVLALIPACAEQSTGVSAGPPALPEPDPPVVEVSGPLTAPALDIVEAHDYPAPTSEALQDELRRLTEMTTLSVLGSQTASLLRVGQGELCLVLFTVQAMDHCRVRAPVGEAESCEFDESNLTVANESATQLGVALLSYARSGALELRSLRFMAEGPTSPGRPAWEPVGTGQAPWSAAPNQEADFKLVRTDGGDLDGDDRLEFVVELDFSTLDHDPYTLGCDGPCEDYEPSEPEPEDYTIHTAGRRRLLVLRTDLSLQLDLIVQHENTEIWAHRLLYDDLLLRALQVVQPTNDAPARVELRACEIEALLYSQWGGAQCLVDALCSLDNVVLTMLHEIATDAYSKLQKTDRDVVELSEDEIDERCSDQSSQT